MPEFPEVETIRRDLEHVILHKEITDVEVRNDRLVRGVLVRFLETLQSNVFTNIDRRGKLLLLDLAQGGRTLLIHLRMTGQLIAQIPGGLVVDSHKSAKTDDLPNDHTHVIFHFTDGTTLYFNDVRTFGYMQLVDHQERTAVLNRFGLEPLSPEFTWSNFKALLQNREGVLKALLLNQQLIAGLGNIYADEICFRAKLRPDRKVDSLSSAERRRLFNACQSVIRSAIEKRGTTFSNYVDVGGEKGGYADYLKVYNREGETCLRCKKNIVKKIKLIGRGTHFCSVCQQ